MEKMIELLNLFGIEVTQNDKTFIRFSSLFFPDAKVSQIEGFDSGDREHLKEVKDAKSVKNIWKVMGENPWIAALL